MSKEPVEPARMLVSFLSTIAVFFIYVYVAGIGAITLVLEGVGRPGIIPILFEPYNFVAITYGLTGITLMALMKKRYQSLFILMFIGSMQEVTWNISYWIVKPDFIAHAMATDWAWIYYVAIVLFLATTMSFYFRKKVRFHPLVLVFVAYYFIYFAMRDPIYAVTTNTPLWEFLFVLTLIISLVSSLWHTTVRPRT